MPSRPRSHRLRRGRHSESGRAYLITTVVHQRQPLFSDWRLGRLVVTELRQVQDLGLADSLAWVLMPDHLHWLLQLRTATLPEVMQRVKSRSTRQLNQHLGLCGALWQSGYHDRAIRDGEDIQPLARYIVANPLRAGLAQRIGDYPLWDACWLQ
ncbi:REP-associated tyrosine transposase [Pseudomonas sp. L5B5]|uniref:REP-associated tyrosine transposase n=1 Tax=Pseudomonas sp. L5B5 TaxID=2883205 RepID=UPI0007308F5A|nr:transposase [Pseudomonas sp. L5B5]KTC43541.1 transposase [Pseudomonas sp. ABAC61]UCZ83704.1 transposase [Pseudomonas sp. L5B5]